MECKICFTYTEDAFNLPCCQFQICTECLRNYLDISGNTICINILDQNEPHAIDIPKEKSELLDLLMKNLMKVEKGEVKVIFDKYEKIMKSLDVYFDLCKKTIDYVESSLGSIEELYHNVTAYLETIINPDFGSRDVVTSVSFYDDDNSSLARHYTAWACISGLMGMTSSRLIGGTDFYFHSDMINRYLNEIIIPIRKASSITGISDEFSPRSLEVFFRLVPTDLETSLMFGETHVDLVKVNEDLMRFRDDLQYQIHKILEDFEKINSSYEFYIEILRCLFQNRIIGRNLYETLRKGVMSRFNNRKPKSSHHKFFCTKVGCEGTISIGTGREDCYKCGTSHCKRCGEAEGDREKCENQKCSPGIPFVQCPKCKVGIEKYEGCDQILCKNCKHKFDYKTLNSLEGDPRFHNIDEFNELRRDRGDFILYLDNNELDSRNLLMEEYDLLRSTLNNFHNHPIIMKIRSRMDKFCIKPNNVLQRFNYFLSKFDSLVNRYNIAIFYLTKFMTIDIDMNLSTTYINLEHCHEFLYKMRENPNDFDQLLDLSTRRIYGHKKVSELLVKCFNIVTRIILDRLILRLSEKLSVFEQQFSLEYPELDKNAILYHTDFVKILNDFMRQTEKECKEKMEMMIRDYNKINRIDLFYEDYVNYVMNYMDEATGLDFIVITE